MRIQNYNETSKGECIWIKYDGEINGFVYCEWSAASDACHICQSLHAQMWHINEAPKIVEDTHTHCRCRKLPITTSNMTITRMLFN